MQLGDATAGERTQRSPLDVALDAFDGALHGLINTIETGGLEHLSAAEKISFWQKFETSRNRLPLIDHARIRRLHTQQELNRRRRAPAAA